VIFFTICSNNYLAQATVLGNSIAKHHPGAGFIVVLVDERTTAVDYTSIPFEVLPIHEVEPNLNDLIIKYDIVELNTCIKPRIFEYLAHERNEQQIIYLDPDIKIYSPLSTIQSALEASAIVLTPHIYTPIPLDGKAPGENTFLNFGIYNLGFIAIRVTEESNRFISWWKERTYEQGYSSVQYGLYVDQLYINLVPVFFKDVCVLNDNGCNMAPWNLHERFLTYSNNDIIINGTNTLKFFHFSSFRIDTGELPVHYYTRFYMKDRPDLVRLYKEYNDELKAAGYLFYSPLKCSYILKREQYLQQKWKKKPLLKRMAIRTLRTLPKTFRTALANI
jgi:hypothetical protein